MKRALVTGATGKIGPLLVAELLRQQFRVRLFLRDRSAASAFPPDVELFYGDITDYPAVLAAVSGSDAVFHLAALLHINNPSPSLYYRYHQINVTGTSNVVDASFVAGVERVVLFSTISVYGEGSPCQIFSERSPVNPMTIYAETKRLAEKIAQERSMDSSAPTRVTILRLAAVYGTRVAGNYLRLVQAVRRGFVCIPVQAPDSSAAVRTLIHENDVVSGAILAATHPAAAGKIYNLTDGALHRLDEIINAVADALRVEVSILRVPEKPLKRLSDFIHSHHHIISKHEIMQPLGHNIEKAACMIDKLMENSAVDGQKIERELGFKPKYNLKMGWDHALNITEKLEGGSSF